MIAPRQRAARPFEEIVAEHGALVMRVCRALVGPADAADAWSETFLSALQAYPRLPAGSNIRGWLVTIAHRKAIDQVRGAARRPNQRATSPSSPSPSRRLTTRPTSSAPVWTHCRPSSVGR